MNTQNKIVETIESLPDRLAMLARPIVFTNGCFDILHRGHADYLERAASLGASLVVGVNTDASVRRLNKGSDRPINPLADRMALLAALACTALIVPFDEDTPLRLIEAIKPEILVKGGDWPLDKIVGAAFVIQYGGEVHSIPFAYQRSTTDLLLRIRGHE